MSEKSIHTVAISVCLLSMLGCGKRNVAANKDVAGLPNGARNDIGTSRDSRKFVACVLTESDEKAILCAVKNNSNLLISYGGYDYYSDTTGPTSRVIVRTFEGSMFRIHRFALLERVGRDRWNVSAVSPVVNYNNESPKLFLFNEKPYWVEARVEKKNISEKLFKWPVE